MKVMLLAAGRGQRMRPLTDTRPKPLLEVGGKPLIVWHIERLRQAGLCSLVINHAWLGGMIESTLGDGSALGVDITYSAEGEALETAGGIAHALPLLGSDPFLVINSDIFCTHDASRAVAIAARMQFGGDLAWLVMVPNPPQHPAGDFGLDRGRMFDHGEARLTFSGIGIYQPALFAGVAPGSRLAPLLRAAMAEGRVGGELFTGRWEDVGTPGRLLALDRELTRQSE